MEEYCPECEGVLGGDGKCQWCAAEPITLFTGIDKATYLELLAENARLRELVRGMGRILNRFVNEYYGITSESLQIDAKATKEILNRPEVQAIMKGEE